MHKIQIDWQTAIQFSEMVKGMPGNEPIFVTDKIYNSTVNDIWQGIARRRKSL